MRDGRSPAAGGNTTGAVLIDGVIHKRASPWTPTVHALLRYLEEGGFPGAPRALGFDSSGREMLGRANSAWAWILRRLPRLCEAGVAAAAVRNMASIPSSTRDRGHLHSTPAITHHHTSSSGRSS